MALVIKDRIKETTTTTGTGTYSLAGAEAGFQAFSEIGDGNTCYYACTDNTDFEVGIGTFTASGSTLARTTILESSNSDAAVNWGAGAKDIFVTAPADKIVYEDASGNITVSGTVDGRDIATDGTKLDGIEASADVTDTTNVTAAGALMDSEVTNLAQVKAFDASDYATAAQGSTADAAMPKSGGTFTGDVTIEDNEKLYFGDTQDLSIHHYADNWIVSNTGDLHIRQEATDKDVKIQADNANGHAVDYFQADGSTGEVVLSHFGYPKIKTKSTGADITGDITVSGTVDGVDIAARDAVLTSTTTTANAAMPTSGGTFTGDVTLLNSGDGSLASPYLKLKRDSASPAAWDYLGIIRFLGEDGGSNETPYSTILGRIVDPTGGSEDGRIEIHQMKGGTETLTYVFDHDAFQLQNEQPIKWKEHHGTAYDVFVEPATPTADRTITLPDQTGTAMLWQSAWPDDPTENSIAIGNNALINANSSAVRNTVVGYDAGDAITSGARNSLIGDNAGSLLTTGSNCTAVGQNAMGHNTTDSHTTAIGAQSGGGDFLTGGTYVGSYAGNLISNSKDYQVAIGYLASDDNAGDNSVAIGAFAMSDGNHYRSVAVGHDALGISSSSNPYYNVAVGMYAGNALNWGDGNVLIGYNADVLYGGTEYAVAIGQGADAAGSYSVSIGNNASASSYNGGSAYCVNIGNQAGYDMDGGDYCTFVGNNAGYAGGTGNYNTSVGSTSLYQLTSGEKNSAFGNNCLQSITSGDYNTGVGGQAGQAATTGSNNTVLGYYAGQIQDGSTANQLTTGSNVTCVGSEAMPSNGTATNEITLGDNDITSLRCNVQTISSLSDERDKTAIKDLTFGLDFINDMRPVEFTWNRRDGSLGAKTDMGFIAQELYDVELDHSSSSRTRLVNWENPEKLEADYVRSYPILVKAVQELSAQVTALQARIETLEGN